MTTMWPFRLAGTVLLVISVALVFATGCSIVTSDSHVLGEYELKVGSGRIELKVSPDKSFSETIYWADGKIESRSGKWLWNRHILNFDQLWIPTEFAPDYILQADADAKANRQPKYTEPGHWAIQPERHWGTVILPIFPDADVSFRMVRPYR